MNRHMRTATCAIALSAGWSASAAAYVTVDPADAPAGASIKLSFRVTKGCDGSPTTAVQIALPDGVAAVVPKVHAGWTITTKKSDMAKPTKDGHGINSETPSEVTWTGGPLPNEYMDEFELAVQLPDDPGKALVFPVTQTCETGVIHWRDALGKAKGNAAPVLRLGKAKD